MWRRRSKIYVLDTGATYDNGATRSTLVQKTPRANDMIWRAAQTEAKFLQVSTVNYTIYIEIEQMEAEEEMCAAEKDVMWTEADDSPSLS